MKHNITTLRSTADAIAADLTQMNQLAALASDLREGRGCVIMMGKCAVSISIKGGHPTVTPGCLLEVVRYSKAGAVARVNAMPNIADFRVLPFSAAVSAQQTLMEASLSGVNERINHVMGAQ